MIGYPSLDDHNPCSCSATTCFAIGSALARSIIARVMLCDAPRGTTPSKHSIRATTTDAVGSALARSNRNYYYYTLRLTLTTSPIIPPYKQLDTYLPWSKDNLTPPLPLHLPILRYIL